MRSDLELDRAVLTQKGERSRERFIAAARQVFERDGFLEARVTDIADLAGFSHGTFYHYFDSKEAVLRVVATDLADRLVPALDAEALAMSSDPTRALVRHANEEFLSQYRAEWRLIEVVEQCEHLDPELRRERLNHRQLHAKITAAAIREQQVAGNVDLRLDPEVAAVALAAIAMRFASLWTSGQLTHCSLTKAANELTTLICNALGLPDDARAHRAKQTRRTI